jgi:predicted dehydrogenase
MRPRVTTGQVAGGEETLAGPGVAVSCAHGADVGGSHGAATQDSVTAYRLGSYLRSGALGRKEHYTDPTTELMTFDFDFVQWLLGPPNSISATAAKTESGSPGEVSAILDYDAGYSATVVASGIMPKGFPFSVGFRVLFEKGAFELETVFEGVAPKNRFLFYSDDKRSQTIVIQEHNPYERELQYFVDCVRCEADPESLDAPWNRSNCQSHPSNHCENVKR